MRYTTNLEHGGDCRDCADLERRLDNERGQFQEIENNMHSEIKELQSTVKRLQEENERYKKALMAVRDFDDDNMDYDDPGAIAIEALKSSELNKEEHGE